MSPEPCPASLFEFYERGKQEAYRRTEEQCISAREKRLWYSAATGLVTIFITGAYLNYMLIRAEKRAKDLNTQLISGLAERNAQLRQERNKVLALRTAIDDISTLSEQQKEEINGLRTERLVEGYRQRHHVREKFNLRLNQVRIMNERSRDQIILHQTRNKYDCFVLKRDVLKACCYSMSTAFCILSFIR